MMPTRGRAEAVLYVYHESPAMCASRVRLLRALNPGVHLYGIFGGEPDAFGDFAEVNGLLDDAWCCGVGTGKWRWMNMDKVIGLWYEARGRHLPWDVIFEHQGDLLVTAPIRDYLDLVPRQDQILFHETPRSYSELLHSHWPWVVAGLTDLKNFMVWLHEQYGPKAQFRGGNVLFTVCTRRYVHAFQEIIADIPGVMEYRAPSMALALGYEMVEFEMPAAHRASVSFSKVPLDPAHVIDEMGRPDGARMFHRVNAALEPDDLPRLTV